MAYNDKGVGTRSVSHGKVYKLYSDVDQYFYIGSTIKTLKRRLDTHKRAAETMTSKVYNHFNRIGTNEMRITTLEEVTGLSNRKALRIVENTYIEEHRENPLCLNTNLAFIDRNDPAYRHSINKRKRELRKQTGSHKKYYLEHKDAYAKYARDNKVKIQEQIRVKTTCACGAEIRRYYYKTHLGQSTHAKWLLGQLPFNGPD